MTAISRRKFTKLLSAAAGGLTLGAVASKLASGKTTEQTNWLLPRGDAGSTGRTEQTLPEKLDVLWEAKAGEAIEGSLVVGDGRVIGADVMGKVYAFDEKSGDPLWTRDFGTGFLTGVAPAVSGNTVVIGDYEGNVFALDAKTGEERWRKTTDGEVAGSVGFYEGNVLVPSSGGSLYSFALEDGELKWTYDANDQIRCSPTVAGDRTFLGGCDGNLHVIDLKTGKAASEPLPLGGPTGSTPSVIGTSAFVPIMDGDVLAFDFKTGKQLWRYRDPDRSQEYRNSPAATEDLVIVSSQFKQVDAISTKTGEHQWRYTLKRRAEASPVIAGEDVWLAASDGRLIRLSLTDGTEKWTYEVRGSFIASPAIANERLYIADDDGVIRCFGSKTQVKKQG
ncbi:MAG: PQQ-binding-like beta-propeller repeat protein [Planctomycetota bacterium]